MSEPVVLQAAKGKRYTGKSRTDAVARMGGQCRYLWNLFLAESIERHRAEKKFVFYAEMSARLPKLLKSDPKLAGLPHRAAQMTIQKLDRALRDCLKRAANRKGFPRFKRRDDRSDALSLVARECRFEAGRVRLPEIGWMRVRGLSVPDRIDLGNEPVAIIQRADRWHIAVPFAAPPKDYGIPPEPIVDIDGGLNDALIFSDKRFVAFRPAKKAAKRIHRLNRERDRRRKGSIDRRRSVARLGRLHRAISDRISRTRRRRRRSDVMPGSPLKISA